MTKGLVHQEYTTAVISHVYGAGESILLRRELSSILFLNAMQYKFKIFKEMDQPITKIAKKFL